MMPWLTQINGLIFFHPERWPRRELIGRCAALSIVALFLAWKVIQFDDFPQRFETASRFYSAIRSPAGVPLYTPAAIAWLWGVKLAVWLVECLIYIGYIAAYLSRCRAQAVAQGFMETAFPLFVAGLPVVMVMAPYNLPRWMPFTSQGHLPFYLTVMALILSGGLINLIGLLTLRRAFTIMTEARALITHGPFRWVRHPLYTGHFILFLGALLLRLHGYTVALYLLFVASQVWRAAIEERKLIRAFPAYSGYRQKTGMFFPKWNKFTLDPSTPIP
jgi:protein-S-isoprenylcysteine O-methyltransferase Ste14